MKFNQKLIGKFQEGGQMMPEEQGAPMGPEAAPTEAQGGPEEQIAQMGGELAQMLLQQLQDPQAVMAVLEAAMQAVQQMAAPAQPTYQRLGGRLVRK